MLPPKCWEKTRPVFWSKRTQKKPSNGLKHHQSNSNSKKCMFVVFKYLQSMGKTGWHLQDWWGMLCCIKRARCSGLTATLKIEASHQSYHQWNCYVGVILSAKRSKSVNFDPNVPKKWCKHKRSKKKLIFEGHYFPYLNCRWEVYRSTLFYKFKHIHLKSWVAKYGFMMWFDMSYGF